MNDSRSIINEVILGKRKADEVIQNMQLFENVTSTSVRQSIGCSVCHDYIKGQEVTLPCSYRSTCFNKTLALPTVGIVKDDLNQGIEGPFVLAHKE